MVTKINLIWKFDLVRHKTGENVGVVPFLVLMCLNSKKQDGADYRLISENTRVWRHSCPKTSQDNHA